MKRTDLLDTSIEMHKLRIRMLRDKSPTWRLRYALECTDDLNIIRETTKQYRAKDPA